MIDITWIVVICFTGVAIIYLILEQAILRMLRRHFKIVIHVNGTRGKSTVARYMDGILREAGYQTFTKTTGTLPIIHHVNGSEEKIKRWGRANIREQAHMMMKAYREGAEVLILECMAVDPVLQWYSEHRMLHADINIITNVRLDHIGEMGSCIEDIARSLANTASLNTIVVSADQDHGLLIEEAVKKMGATFVFAPPSSSMMNIPLLEENVSVAVKTAQILGIRDDVIGRGIESYHPDPGAFDIQTVGQTILINAFSANDPTSTMALYGAMKKRYSEHKITWLLNNRGDRPERTLQNIALIKKVKPHRVLLAGDNSQYVYRAIRSTTDVYFYHKVEDLLEEDVIFAFGNIGNQGFKILQACNEWRKNHGC